MNVHEIILSVMQNIEYRVRPDKIQSILDKWREALNLDDIITYELSDSGLIMDIFTSKSDGDVMYQNVSIMNKFIHDISSIPEYSGIKHFNIVLDSSNIA